MLCLVVALLTFYVLVSLNLKIGPVSAYSDPINRILKKNRARIKDGEAVTVLAIKDGSEVSQSKTDSGTNESKTHVTHRVILIKASDETTRKMVSDSQEPIITVSVKSNTFPLTTGDNPFRINNKQICQGANGILFIVLVHTATEHFKRRQSIRETWANISLYKNVHMRVVFLIGLTKKKEIQAELEKENKMHGDLVQGNFLDTYHNLTHKGVMGFKWVTENCRQAKFIVKVDDDVFVNTLQMVDNVLFKNINNSRQILGWVKKENIAPVLRWGKWKVDEDEFINHTHYPFPFCKGFFVILTGDIIEQLYEAAKITLFFWIDDIYLFGLLPHTVGNITHVPLKGLSLSEKKSIVCFNSTETKCPLLVGNAHTDGVMHKLWQGAILQDKEFAMNYLALNSSYGG